VANGCPCAGGITGGLNRPSYAGAAPGPDRSLSPDRRQHWPTRRAGLHQRLPKADQNQYYLRLFDRGRRERRRRAIRAKGSLSREGAASRDRKRKMKSLDYAGAELQEKGSTARPAMR